MQEQLIINILGNSSLLALSNIAACISQHKCNILDSRHALFGTEFSLTMIVSGTRSTITKLELAVSTRCMQDDLLCMMKRTTGHQELNGGQVINLAFCGPDATGIMHKVTHALALYNVSLSTVRQRTFTLSNQLMIDCEMMLTAPISLDLTLFDEYIESLLHGLDLHGTISHNTLKENDEYTQSW